MADGGVGEAALIGAVIGGGSAAVTGGDPLKGALMGGATSGLMGGIGGLEGVDPFTMGQTGADAFTATQAANAGNAVGAAEGLSYLPGSGYGAALSNPAAGASATNATAFMEPGVTAGTSAITPNVAIPNAIPDPTNQLHGLDLLKANKLPYGAIAVSQGLPGLMQPKGLGNVPGTEKYTGPLSKFRYDPDEYTPDIVRPPNPAYAPAYKTYALGGRVSNPMLSSPTPASTFPTIRFGRSVTRPQPQPAAPVPVDPNAAFTFNPAVYNQAPVASPTPAPIPASIPTAPTPASVISSAPAARVYTPSYKDYSKMADGGLAGSYDQGIAGLSANPSYPMADQQTSRYAVPSQMPIGAQDIRMAHMAPTPMAHGGITDLGGYSDGGRMLKGPGDGMSDSIPASIGGKQPARLADGEFVVPADVVSHLGNGSTDAGAKQLYKMMDKVRTARTGRKAQGKQINPKKYVPA